MQNKIAQVINSQNVSHGDQLRQIRDQISDPLARKYLDKAIEHNGPKVDEDPKKSQISDPNTFVHYQNMLEEVKKYVEIGNHSYDSLKKIYEAQVKLHGAFTRLSNANQFLIPHLIPEKKQIILNEESQGMLSKIQENYEEIKKLIEDIKTLTEQSFDNIHSVVL